MKGFLVWAAVLLAGCSGLQQLTRFEISERELQQAAESAIQSNLEQLPLIESALLKVDLQVEDVSLDLVADAGGAVKAGFASTLTTEVPLVGTVKTQFAPQVRAGLKLDGDAIYLVNPELLSVGAASEAGARIDEWLGQNGVVLRDALDAYFSRNPIYRLDNGPQEKLAAQVLKRIEIRDDRLALVP